MATATFIQTGDVLDYTPVSAKSAGDVVVQSELVGVCPCDIDASALGALCVSGVWQFPCAAAGTGTAIAFGDNVYWDESETEAVLSSSGNKLIGKAVETVSATGTTVKVRLNQ